MKKLLLVWLLLFQIAAIAQVQYGGGVNTFTSTANSSTATLTSGSTFTGTSDDVSQYAEVRITVKSDVASATDGLSIQSSPDGTNWDILDVYTIPAATGKAFGIGVSEKFFRIVYTNGGTNQTSFRLQTIFHKVRTKPSSNRPQDARTNDNDMEENLAYGMEYDPIANTWNRTQTQFQYFTGQSAQTATVNNIIPVAVSSSATDLSGYGSALVQIICPAGTYTTGAIIFEGANDSPTSSVFQTIPVYNQLTGASLVAAITLATTTNIGYTFPVNFRYIRVRISTAVSGASASVQAISKFSKTAWTNPFITVIQPTAANLNVTATGTLTANLGTGGTSATSLAKAEDAAAANGDTNPAIMALRNDALTSNTSASGDYGVPTTDTYGALLMKDEQRHKVSYSMAFTVSPAATATDIFQLIGSSTKTVEIEKITITGTMTTGGPVVFIVSKRSTANSGGTSSGGTAVPHNSALAAATAVGTIYTANPTTGTPVGDIERAAINIPTVTGTASTPLPMTWYDIQPPLLSGVAQALVISLGGVTLTGASINVSINFVEY